MRITFFDTNVSVKSGTSKKTGNNYSIREQEGSGENSRFRTPVRLTLGDQQAAYEPGVYELDYEKALQVDRYGGISLVRQLPLKRVADLPKAKA